MDISGKASKKQDAGEEMNLQQRLCEDMHLILAMNLAGTLKLTDDMKNITEDNLAMTFMVSVEVRFFIYSKDAVTQCVGAFKSLLDKEHKENLMEKLMELGPMRVYVFDDTSKWYLVSQGKALSEEEYHVLQQSSLKKPEWKMVFKHNRYICEIDKRSYENIEKELEILGPPAILKEVWEVVKWNNVKFTNMGTLMIKRQCEKVVEGVLQQIESHLGIHDACLDFNSHMVMKVAEDEMWKAGHSSTGLFCQVYFRHRSSHQWYRNIYFERPYGEVHLKHLGPHNFSNEAFDDVRRFLAVAAERFALAEECPDGKLFTEKWRLEGQKRFVPLKDELGV